MFVKEDYFRQADYFHPYIFLGVPQAILLILVVRPRNAASSHLSPQ